MPLAFYSICMQSVRTFSPVDKPPTGILCRLPPFPRLSTARDPRRASRLGRHAIARGANIAARATSATLVDTMHVYFCCDDCTVAGRWAEAATTVDSRNSASEHLYPLVTQARPMSSAGTETSRSIAGLTVAAEARERNCILAVRMVNWL
jgi:hypothetical protein